MKPYKPFFTIVRIYGIIITTLMILIFGGSIVNDLIDKGAGEFGTLLKGSLHWYDDPTGFFFTYLVGYALVWWKPLWGGLIIIAGSLAVSIVNIDSTAFIIFSLPAMLVGVLYIILFFISLRKK